jgi:hypothetical protein
VLLIVFAKRGRSKDEPVEDVNVVFKYFISNFASAVGQEAVHKTVGAKAQNGSFHFAMHCILGTGTLKQSTQPRLNMGQCATVIMTANFTAHFALKKESGP